MQYWSVKNPHCMKEVDIQNHRSFNVRSYILWDQNNGPYVFQGYLNGEMFLDHSRMFQLVVPQPE